MAISQSSNRAMRNPWVLGMLGFIGTVVTVNVIFITNAISSSPGLVDANYYEAGRHFEDNLLQRIEMVNRLQWDMRLQTPNEVVMNQRSSIYLNLTDKVGQPLTDVDVQVQAYRPSDASADFDLVMEAFAPGVYKADAVFPLRGVWDLRIKVAQGEDNIEKRHRINVLTN